MTDRVGERRRAVALARHYRDQEGLTIAEIARRLGRAEGTVKAFSTIRSRKRRARSRRAIGARAVGAARRRARGAARGTRTNTASAAVPGRSRGNGPASGSVTRCAPGERATALRRPPTTGRAPTHAGAAAKRSNDYKPENGPRGRLSSICTGAGRRPSPTPSAAPERLGVKTVDIRTRACAWPPVNGSAEARHDRFCHSSVGEAPRREPAVVCQQPSVVRSPQFGDRRRSRPRGRRDYRNRGVAIARAERAREQEQSRRAQAAHDWILGDCDSARALAGPGAMRGQQAPSRALVGVRGRTWVHAKAQLRADRQWGGAATTRRVSRLSDRSGASRRRTLLRTGRASFPASGSSKP